LCKRSALSPFLPPPSPYFVRPSFPLNADVAIQEPLPWSHTKSDAAASILARAEANEHLNKQLLQDERARCTRVLFELYFRSLPGLESEEEEEKEKSEEEEEKEESEEEVERGGREGVA